MIRVFVAEDEPWIRRKIVDMVETTVGGYTVVGEAVNGEEAWECIQELWPTIVITDIRMPRRDGLWLIRKIEEYKLPIVSIIISGYDDFSYAQQAVRYDVSEYLLKPVMALELVEALQRSLGQMNRFKEMNDHLIEMQVFIEQIPNMSQLQVIQGMNGTVRSILKMKVMNRRTKIRLLEILSGKLSGLLQSLGASCDELIVLDEQDNEALYSYFGKLAESISRHIHENSSSLYHTKGVIRKACQYIEKNYMKPLTIRDLADYSHLSISHFSLLFKQYTQMSFVNYINQLRINKAKELLLEEDLKIYEVAEMIGFVALPYFNRLFKQVTGMPPSEYKKSMGL